MRVRAFVGGLVVVLLSALLGPGAGTAHADSVDCRRAKCVALTYDDGPAAESTGILLDHLRAHRVRATFFMLGVQADRFPRVARRVADEGHEIANHTYGHKDLRTLRTAEVRREVVRGAAAVARATGRHPSLVRPPYGSQDQRVRAAINAPVVLWSVDPRDWADREARTVTSRVLGAVRPGSIVLMHDIHRSTADAAPAIVTGLRKQGYRLVTVSELYGGAKLTAAKVYRQR
ncbi:polysaccharide deacetylase family protein [Yinghuangia sp. YIM S09857]|uniref:polysaccharide deacetylase family protein n=1 Tax=Yinghuangia sp. YIM S09857 TaxID=3436929 RepID=UPI003F539018